MEQADEIIEKIKLVYVKDDVKKEVLDSEWYEKNIATGIDLTGFCYAACEVIYRLTGGK